MEKVKVTQDTLYEYILAHDVKLTRLAEMIGRAPEVVMSCFKHHNDWHGRPRRFNKGGDAPGVDLTASQIDF